MKLSIITINYNNLAGLQKTAQSVLQQCSNDFEYIIVDGGSKDGSKEYIEKLVKSENRISYWISEPDNGIYSAMNKGIKQSKGEYLQFLNSGDFLVNDLIVESMIKFLKINIDIHMEDTQIMYGNMLKVMPNGLLKDKGFAGRQPTFLDFYRGTLNHSPAYIKRNLFEKYGLYDENLKIVSDWKWYLNVIIFEGVNPVYVDIDVTLFDMSGISTINTELDRQERTNVLGSLLPLKVLADYQRYSFPISQWNRFQRFKFVAFLFWFIERILFQFEKIRIKIFKEVYY